MRIKEWRECGTVRDKSRVLVKDGKAGWRSKNMNNSDSKRYSQALEANKAKTVEPVCWPVGLWLYRPSQRRKTKTTIKPANQSNALWTSLSDNLSYTANQQPVNQKMRWAVTRWVTISSDRQRWSWKHLKVPGARCVRRDWMFDAVLLSVSAVSLYSSAWVLHTNLNMR